MERRSLKKDTTKISPWTVVDINRPKETYDLEFDSSSLDTIQQLKTFFEFEISNYTEYKNTHCGFVPLQVHYFQQHLKKMNQTIMRLEKKLSVLKKKYDTWEINSDIPIHEDISRQTSMLESKAFEIYKNKRYMLETTLLDMKIVYNHIHDEMLPEQVNTKPQGIEMYKRALQYINTHFTTIFSE